MPDFADVLPVIPPPTSVNNTASEVDTEMHGLLAEREDIFQLINLTIQYKKDVQDMLQAMRSRFWKMMPQSIVKTVFDSRNPEVRVSPPARRFAIYYGNTQIADQERRRPTTTLHEIASRVHDLPRLIQDACED